jgi:hypothetical protein
LHGCAELTVDSRWGPSWRDGLGDLEPLWQGFCSGFTVCGSRSPAKGRRPKRLHHRSPFFAVTRAEWERGRQKKWLPAASSTQTFCKKVHGFLKLYPQHSLNRFPSTPTLSSRDFSSGGDRRRWKTGRRRIRPEEELRCQEGADPVLRPRIQPPVPRLRSRGREGRRRVLWVLYWPPPELPQASVRGHGPASPPRAHGPSSLAHVYQQHRRGQTASPTPVRSPGPGAAAQPWQAYPPAHGRLVPPWPEEAPALLSMEDYRIGLSEQQPQH